MDIDVDQLITEVHSLPLLWNSSDLEYKDRHKKEVAWATVAERLFERYTTEDDRKKKVLVECAKQKWKTLRDGYTRWRRAVKTTRSGSKASKRTYCYGEVMSFLSVNSELKGTESSNEPHDDVDEEEEENEDCEHTSLRNDDMLNDLSLKDGVQTLPGENSTATVTPTSIQAGSQILQKRKSPNKYTYNTKKSKPTKLEADMSEYFQLAKSCFTVQPATIDEEEDLNFFKSLVPSLRGLNMQQKLRFRMQVMTALQSVLCATTSSATTHANQSYIHSQQFPHNNMQHQYSHHQQYPNVHHEYPHLQNVSSTRPPSPHYVASSPLMSPHTPASHLSLPLLSPGSSASSTHSINAQNSSSTLIDYNFMGDNSPA